MSTSTTASTLPSPPAQFAPADVHAPSVAHTAPLAPPAVDIVLPVHNEQDALGAGVHELHAHLAGTCACSWRITIAENASTDATPRLADELARMLPGVRVLHLAEKGRGRALRTAWADSDATVVGYMDIDLSTDLHALDALLAPLLAGRGDVAIGSRLVPGARVTRSLRREVISRTYNLLLRALLGVTVADAQCGFKAARSEVVADLLPRIEDDGWFFDTELIHLAQRGRYSVREVPVQWVEDRDSRVAIIATVFADLRGIARLRRRPATPATPLVPDPAEVPGTAGDAPAAGSEVTHDHTLRPHPQRRAALRARRSSRMLRAPRESRLAA